jgi:hypothetical protein
MKHNFPNNCSAAHFGGGSRGQGGAQQGTGARGEQYVDGVSRSHTLAAGQLFGTANTNNPLCSVRFFEASPVYGCFLKENLKQKERKSKRMTMKALSGVRKRHPALTLWPALCSFGTVGPGR